MKKSYKKALLYTLIIATLTITSSCTGTFSEQQIENYIIEQTGKDKDSLSNEDLAQISSLYLYDISKLSDIKKLSGLTELSITDSDISDWKYLYNTKLSSLELWNNTGEIDISKIDKGNLSNLVLMGNGIKNIDSIKNATELKTLTIWNFPNTDFSFLSEMTNLESLEIVNSELSDISFLENFKNLKSLTLSENIIDDISVLSKMVSIQYLDLHDNHIKNIEALSNIIDLQELNVSKNRIIDLSPLSNLTGLLNLNVSHNCIENINNLKTLRFLKTVNISCNRIADISPLNTIGELREIIANNNKITDISYDILSRAYYIDVASNNIKIGNAKFMVALEQNKNDDATINLFDNFLTKNDIVSLSKIESVKFLSNGLPVSAEGYIEYIDNIKSIVEKTKSDAKLISLANVYKYFTKNFDRVENENTDNSLGSFNVIVNNKGTSLDFSDAFSAVMRRLGIDADIYCGSKFGSDDNDHYWNIVYVDGRMSYIDTFCDTNIDDRPEYFGINDEQMGQNGHILLDDYYGRVMDEINYPQ